MKITLVAIHPVRSPQSLPLANAFLAATLLQSPDLKGRITVTLIDLYSHQSPEESALAIAATNPDVTGFSVYVWNREQSIAIAKQLRDRTENLILFCGGPEATASPVSLLDEAPFDFLISGEGEIPLLNITRLLLDGRDFSGTPGCGLIKDGRYLFTPGEAIKDLDSIPSPFLSGLLQPAEYQGFLWQLSRGCFFDCDFCFDAKETRGVRRFGMERVVAELAWLVRNEVSQVFVLDSTFNQDKERAAAILGLIAREAPHIHFHFEVRSEFIDKKQARLFAAITCSLQIGLQSCRPEVLKKVNRIFNRADFIRRITLLNESGAIFGFDLIYGLPGDTLEGFRESLEFALSLYPNHLDIFPLALLPGTKLAARSSSLGLVHLPHPPYSLLESASFSAEEMAEAKKLAAACDIFYSRGKAVAWFASVTEGLAISACSLLEQFYHYPPLAALTAAEQEMLSDSDIWRMQRDFLKELFRSKGADHLLPLILDLVDYNYYYAAALMTVPPQPPDELELQQSMLAELPLTLAESARLAKFNFEILEIMETGSSDLHEFVKYYNPTGSLAVIYPLQGEIRTESLIEPYYLLLELLDGITPVGRLAEKLRIPVDEAVSFLEFAVSEGIAILPANGAVEVCQ